ncbi:cilia- and flagella-associated protein 157-like isoform X2 [Clinocottus analis]|uniref:cilia- and flagella-associated protein 157-like isoform X2 n=1 Tax=Clinocottus analis TaxID=304258 RepID=UPI0035C21589
MPRKKEKKQDEVKKTAKKESSSTPADKSGSEDKEKSLYLIQIRYLNEQLERYQLECDLQERQKKELDSRYGALEEEKNDVVAFLKRSVLEKEAEAEQLTEQLESRRRASGEDAAALRRQLGEMREELGGRVEELEAENTTLAARLAVLEEFQEQKEQLTSDLESVRKQLCSQEVQHRAALHHLEMKALLEKKSLEEEMEGHVATMAAEVQHLVDQKVPAATKSALQENTEVKARMGRLSEQTLTLMEENSDLRDRKSRLSVDLHLLEEMLHETTRKSCVRKKVAEQMTAKCRQLQAELEDEKRERERRESEHTGALAEMEALRRERASLSERCADGRAQVSRLEAELQKERRRRSRMKSIMQEAAVALRQALMDAPADQEEEEEVQWKRLMEKLLVVLDRPEHDQPDELQASDPSASGAASLNPALSLQFQLARYRPGDLGLVPRPAPRHKAAARGPLHRKRPVSKHPAP